MQWKNLSFVAKMQWKQISALFISERVTCHCNEEGQEKKMTETGKRKAHESVAI